MSTDINMLLSDNGKSISNSNWNDQTKLKITKSIFWNNDVRFVSLQQIGLNQTELKSNQFLETLM